MSDHQVSSRVAAGVYDELIDRAARLTRHLLADDPERLAHSAAVAARAAALALTVDPREEAELVAAAWLHDIGYAAALRQTGFHPLDGARALRAWGWQPELCGLVAYHSGSRYTAAQLGLAEQLARFDIVTGPVADALTAADQTIGPGGQPMHFEQRMRDMLDRHGPSSANARAHPQRAPYLRAVARRVAIRLRRSGHEPARYGLDTESTRSAG
jgi:hypothetical protein